MANGNGNAVSQIYSPNPALVPILCLTSLLQFSTATFLILYWKLYFKEFWVITILALIASCFGGPVAIYYVLKGRRSDRKRRQQALLDTPAIEILVETPDINWEDIGGLENAKNRLQQLAQHSIFSPADAIQPSPPRGALLYGHPGCGRTLLAMAFARQCGANFIRVKGQERLGRSIANVRDVFSKVKAAAPVVFYIDQIDFIAPTAGVLDGVFLQVLNELDKLGQATVFIIGSTYRPRLVDPAILQLGLLDQLIHVPFPDAQSRRQILNVNQRKFPAVLSGGMDLDFLANNTTGFSGAVLANMWKDAIDHATREAQQHLQEGRIGPRTFSLRRNNFEAVLHYPRRAVFNEVAQECEDFARTSWEQRTGFATV